MAASPAPVRQGPARPARAGRRTASSFKPGRAASRCCKFTSTRRTTACRCRRAGTSSRRRSRREPPEFTGNQLRTLDVEMFLDATDEDERRRRRRPSTLLFSTVRPTEKSISAGTPFPPIVVFSWGDATAVRRRRQVGERDAHAVPAVRASRCGRRARCRCRSSTRRPAKQNPTSGALRSTRAHRVVLGDSLASIANAEYGDADAVAGDRHRQRARGPVQPAHRHASCSSPPPPTPPPWPERMAAQRSSNVFADQGRRHAARPTTSPAALLEAFVEDEVNLPDTFELVFRDPLRTVLAAGGFEIGKKLTITVVSEATPAGTPIFDGEITAVEAEIERDQTLTIVRGYDPAHRLQRGTNTETHLDVDVRRHRRQGRRAPRAAEGRRRHQHGRPRGGRAVEPDRLGVPVHAGGRDRPRGRRRRRQAAPPRAGRRRRRRPAAATSQSDDARQLVAGGNLLRLRATVSGAEQVEEVAGPRMGLQGEGGGRGRRPRPADGSRSAAAGTGRGRPRRASSAAARSSRSTCPVDERRGRPGRRRLARRAARQRGRRARRRRRTATPSCAPASRSASPTSAPRSTASTC